MLFMQKLWYLWKKRVSFLLKGLHFEERGSLNPIGQETMAFKKCHMINPALLSSSSKVDYQMKQKLFCKKSNSISLWHHKVTPATVV